MTGMWLVDLLLIQANIAVLIGIIVVVRELF